MASLPRYHIKSAGIDGTLLVIDRDSDEQFRVYTPRFMPQFRGGHRCGLWYHRPVGDLGPVPRSPAFRTASDAVDAIDSRPRKPTPSPAEQRRARLRIIWP